MVDVSPCEYHTPTVTREQVKNAEKRDDFPPAIEIGGRIYEARVRKRLSLAALGRCVGKSRTTVERWEFGVNRPPQDRYESLASALDVSIDWLIWGRGPGPTRNPHAAKLESSPVLPAMYVEDRAEFEARENPHDFQLIPYLRDPAAAGSGRVMAEDCAGYVAIDRAVAPRPEVLRCVRILGNSMSPILPEGSIVAVDTSRRNPSELNGRIVCARCDLDEVVIKRLRIGPHCLILISENPDQDTHAPRTIHPAQDEQPIIGRVVWAWVDLR